MKTQELRVGNFFLDYSGMIQTVSVKTLSDIESDRCGDSKYIPLTKEWLLSLGFNIRNHEDHGHGTIFDLVEKKDGDWQSRLFGATMEHGYKGSGFYVLNAPTCQALKYVHQLQNLYFALTGEELVRK